MAGTYITSDESLGSPRSRVCMALTKAPGPPYFVPSMHVGKAMTGRVNTESRCCCGAARYRIEGRLAGIVHCHCQRCRKLHGSTFVSWAFFDEGTFEWISSRDTIASFDSPDLKQPRAFCRVCGSTTRSTSEAAGRMSFPAIAGSVVDLPPPTLEYHFYLKGRAPWYEPRADKPHLYDVVHPEWRDPGLPNLVRERSAAKLAGSCLCNGVAFEADEPIDMFNCHCARCRFSRGAAYATDLHVAPEAFEWKRGDDLVSRYDGPGAPPGGVAFCAKCGSLVPNVSEASVHVPGGCLDTDPGTRPRAHLHVASKASWSAIEDTVPQFDGELAP